MEPLSRTEPGEWSIVEELYPALRRFAAVVAPSDLEPDDLLQEVEAALRHLPEHGQPGLPPGIGLAVRRALRIACPVTGTRMAARMPKVI
mgnify:CR=1 FL=1